MLKGTYTAAVFTGQFAEPELIREDKRNAMSDGRLAEVEEFYAGASLPQDVREALEQFCLNARGGLRMMISGWGLSETAPACLMVHEPIGRSCVVGVSLPGGRGQADPRCRHALRNPRAWPHVMPGYYNSPARTPKALDDGGASCPATRSGSSIRTMPARG